MRKENFFEKEGEVEKTVVSRHFVCEQKKKYEDKGERISKPKEQKLRKHRKTYKKRKTEKRKKTKGWYIRKIISKKGNKEVKK